MSDVEKYENLVLGSGGAGKFAAWIMGQTGRRTALVERGALGSGATRLRQFEGGPAWRSQVQ
jgi:pyruvate/2-oxoglutarate dehydrogenase complex dihydrolipoamide dehydrogenase (E3) component